MPSLFVISDIHFEHMPEDIKEYRKVISKIPSTDIIVLAGDIFSKSLVSVILPLFQELKPSSEIIYVPGNHEFYGCEFEEFFEVIDKYKWNKFHLLYNSEITLHERRFIGTTLWFNENPLNVIYKNIMADFDNIPNFKNWVYKENEIATNYLGDNLKPNDILITHHLPSFNFVDRVYINDPINRFFVTEILNNILERKVSMAIHGHSHTKFQTKIDNTLFVRNPYGYYYTRPLMDTTTYTIS